MNDYNMCHTYTRYAFFHNLFFCLHWSALIRVNYKSFVMWLLHAYHIVKVSAMIHIYFDNLQSRLFLSFFSFSVYCQSRISC